MAKSTTTRTPPPPHAVGGQASASAPYDLKRTFGRIAWVSAIVILGLAVWAFVAGRGFSLTGGQNGPSIQVDAALAGEVSQEEIDEAQTELEAERNEANAQIALETTSASIDIGGTWFGDMTGGTYIIEQVGNAASITELDGFGNITAVGEGTLTGSTFVFTYDSAAGVSGTGELLLDSTGAFLIGHWQDIFGFRPAQLSRL